MAAAQDIAGEYLVFVLQGSEPCGVGFFISKRYLLTCSHVVAVACGLHKEAPDLDARTVRCRLVTDAESPSFEATVLVGHRAQTRQGGTVEERMISDVALLEVTQHQAPPLAPQVLEFMDVQGNRAVSLRGVDRRQKDSLQIAGGRILGLVKDQRVEVEVDAGAAQLGFSGGPVIDQQTGRVLGMVQQAPRDGGNARFIASRAILAAIKGVPEAEAHVRFSGPSGEISVTPTIAENVRDQSDLVEEKTHDFVGREFVVRALDAFMDRVAAGYFFVCGEPGIGKTSLAAWLVKTRGYVSHFNVAAEGINSAESFLRNISAQLIIRHRLKHSSIPSDVGRDSNFLRQVLNEITKATEPRHLPVVIVVDALDEVEISGRSTHANLLYLLPSLPKGVFVIATARDPDQLGLRIECEHDSLTIDSDGPANQADVRAYLERAAERPKIEAFRASRGMTVASFIEALAAKSECNFMYLRYVLPEIERGVYSGEAGNLPSGLRNYYEQHWQRMKGADSAAWFDYQLPVVMALSVAPGALTIERLAEFAGVSERSRIRSILLDWSPFLSIDTAQRAKGSEQRYRIYHQSFQDFLAAKEEVQDEAVSRREAHRRIAAKMWSELFDDDVQSSGHHANSKGTDGKPGDW